MVLSGCPESPDTSLVPPDASGDTTMGGTTYHEHVRPIIENRCQSCHVEGGAGPFPLETWQQVEPMGPALVFAVESGEMPPWHFDEDCRDIQYSRALSPDELATMTAWRDGGFAEGDPGNYVAPQKPEVAELGQADLVIAPAEGYAASKDAPDDYRCLVIDHTFESAARVVATDVLPGQRSVVHHVLIYAVPAAAQAALDAKVAAEPDSPGYTCFGGPDVETDGLVAAWVPGSPPYKFPDGAALTIEAGSKLVMQVHYNTIAVTDPPTDLTQLALWTMPEAQEPTHDVLLTNMPVRPLEIAAGDPSVTEEQIHDVPGNAIVIGAAPHMHQIGTSASAYLVRPDGSEECLANIPRWDFNWQQFYQYQPEDHVQVTSADKVRVSCTFDNSAENQAVVNGVKQPPRDVTWGEGSFDEMCLVYFMVLLER